MNNIEIYNDFFTEEIREEIWKLLLRPQWGPDGGNDTNWFWHMDHLEKEEYFSQYLYSKICDKLERSFKVRRIYTNGQIAGQVGNPHTDDGDFTFLYYPNPEWKLHYGGNLIFCEYEKEPSHIIGYKPNRAILFPSRIMHYAEAPHRFFTGFRISVAYKFLVQ